MSRSRTAPILDPARWVDGHGDYLYRFALAKVSHPESAEDLVQQTFVAALVARHSFRGHSSERTWLTAILKRKVADWLRKAVQHRALQEIPPDELANTHFTRFGKWKQKPDEWSADNPGKELCQAEFRETLAGCLAKLPPRLRHVFVLRHMDDGSADEICDAVGVSATNLAVMLHRARLRLWHCLTLNWFEEDSGMLSEAPR